MGRRWDADGTRWDASIPRVHPDLRSYLTRHPASLACVPRLTAGIPRSDSQGRPPAEPSCISAYGRVLRGAPYVILLTPGGTPMGRRWDAGGAPMGRRWDAGGAPVGRRWGADGTPVGRRWGADGTPVGRRVSAVGAHEIPAVGRDACGMTLAMTRVHLGLRPYPTLAPTGLAWSASAYGRYPTQRLPRPAPSVPLVHLGLRPCPTRGCHMLYC
jgi:hypothetical protein